jgi:hypothetical protein
VEKPVEILGFLMGIPRKPQQMQDFLGGERYFPQRYKGFREAGSLENAIGYGRSEAKVL